MPATGAEFDDESDDDPRADVTDVSPIRSLWAERNAAAVSGMDAAAERARLEAKARWDEVPEARAEYMDDVAGDPTDLGMRWSEIMARVRHSDLERLCEQLRKKPPMDSALVRGFLAELAQWFKELRERYGEEAADDLRNSFSRVSTYEDDEEGTVLRVAA